MSNTTAALRASVRAGVLRAVGRAEFRKLAAAAQTETLPPDRILWHDDMQTPPAGILLEGYLRLQRCGLDGRRQILNLVLPGEVIGFEDARGRGYTLETATPVRLCRVPQSAVTRLQHDSHGLRAAIFRWQDEKLERLRWLTWAIGALGTEERICAFLSSAPAFLPAARLPGGPVVLTPSLSRRDTADLLATSVESICRVLKELEREGLVRPLAGRRLEIRDPAALRRRSGQRVDALDLAFAAGGPARNRLAPATAVRLTAGGAGPRLVVGAGGPGAR